AQWCRSRHDEPPGFAMLNLTRLHLGIAHESQFQGLGISARNLLVRSAARQPRCARDDLAGALSELSEIDGRDLAALLKQRGHHQLGVRDGPPFVLMLFSRSLFVRHGNTKGSPPRAPFY